MTTMLPLAQVCCPLPSDSPLSAEDAARLAGVFKAVADPGRLRLLSLIASQPEGEACTCDLTEPVGLSQPTVSHHLKVLLEAGLLAREKRGQWTFYRLVPDQLAALRDALQPPVPIPA
jgi:ArsR family transcriptional regulator, arsenate/arsenite/antimonite-responsive transcriptional repressor